MLWTGTEEDDGEVVCWVRKEARATSSAGPPPMERTGRLGVGEEGVGGSSWLLLMMISVCEGVVLRVLGE